MTALPDLSTPEGRAVLYDMLSELGYQLGRGKKERRARTLPMDGEKTIRMLMRPLTNHQEWALGLKWVLDAWVFGNMTLTEQHAILCRQRGKGVVDAWQGVAQAWSRRTEEQRHRWEAVIAATVPRSAHAPSVARHIVAAKRATWRELERSAIAYMLEARGI